MEHSTKKQEEKAPVQRIIILCLCLLASMVGKGYAQVYSTKFLKQLAVQDLEYLREAIKNTHPFPFAYTSEQNFNSMVDREIEAMNDTVKYGELRNAARRIIYYVHCVHSTVLTRKITRREALWLEDKYFPLEVKWIGNEFFVYRNYSKDTLISPGNKLLSINGYSMQVIADSIKTYRSGDGPEVDFIRGMINLPFQFNLLYDLQFPEDSMYEVEYIDSSNQVHTVFLPAIFEPQDLRPEKDSVTYAYINKEKNIHLRFLEPNISLLGITDFDGMLPKHYHYIFKMIADKKSPNLIIDLRYNYGGGMENANRLISYIVDSVFSFSLRTPMQTREFDYYDGNGRFQRIAGILYFMMFDNGTYSIKNGNWYWQSYMEPKKHYNYNGNVYILINEHTLSAASYVASQLKHRAGAILVGSPSGGAEYGNAGYTYTTFTLPNSNSKIKVPHNWINYDIAYTNNHELYPQFTVVPTIDDILQKRDVVLEKTLEKIRGEKAN